MTSAIAMSVMLALALGVFAYLMTPRMKIVLSAYQTHPVGRFDRVPQRLSSVLKFAIGQWRMPREPIAGWAHIAIFSGFMVVALATVLHIGHAFSPAFKLPSPLHEGYGFIKDIFELLVLFGVSYGLWRRLKPKPSRVGRSWEGVFVLVMIFLLMTTDFAITAGRDFLAHGQNVPWWSPGGQLFAAFMQSLSPETNHLLGEGAYWLHCALVLVFLNFLPLGKHFHVITGIPNVFFRSLEPYGQVKKDDFEEAESFGISRTSDLDWTMVMDLYSCTECGRCSVYCPTVLTGKPLEHRQLNKDLKKAVYADAATLTTTDTDKREALPELVGDRISPDTIWACTTCGSCEQECPVFIDNVPRIIEMRKAKVMMEGDIVPELARAYKGMEQNSNPWGIGSDKRDEWAEGLDIPRFSDLENIDADNKPILYWIGCAGSFDDRNKKITYAMVKILQAAKVPFAILGKEEGCTGDPARRTGNEYLFQALAQANVEVLNQYGIDKVLTHCPHCLHTIKTEYPQFGGNYEVIHHSELIAQLVKEGRIDFDKEHSETIAWHDSCYLGRYHDIYDAPRDALAGVPGLKVLEAPRNKSRSVCCGAGGGRFWMEEHIGERINHHRAKELLNIKADKVGSACPFCLIMLRDGIADQNIEDVGTLDLAEIVADAMPSEAVTS